MKMPNTVRAIIVITLFQLAYAVLQIFVTFYAVSRHVDPNGFAFAFLARLGYDPAVFGPDQAGIALADVAAPWGILSVLALLFVWLRKLRALRVVVIIRAAYAALAAFASQPPAVLGIVIPALLLICAYSASTTRYFQDPRRTSPMVEPSASDSSGSQV